MTPEPQSTIDPPHAPAPSPPAIEIDADDPNTATLPEQVLAAPAPAADAPPTKRPLVTVLQGLLIVVILGIVADLTGVLGFFGIDFASLWPFHPVRVEATLIRGTDCAVRMYALPATLDPAQEPVKVLEFLAESLADPNTPALATVNSPLLSLQVTNRTASDAAVVLSNRATVSFTADARAPAHVHAVSLGEGLGCAAGWVQRFEPPVSLAIDGGMIPHIVRSPDGDYFTLATGEFERFSLELPCAAPGSYQAAVQIAYAYSGQRRSVAVAEGSPRLCPQAYTLWQVNAVGELKRLQRYVWNGTGYAPAP